MLVTVALLNQIKFSEHVSELPANWKLSASGRKQAEFFGDSNLITYFITQPSCVSCEKYSETKLYYKYLVSGPSPLHSRNRASEQQFSSYQIIKKLDSSRPPDSSQRTGTNKYPSLHPPDSQEYISDKFSII
jgi:hypothetical protein